MKNALTFALALKPSKIDQAIDSRKWNEANDLPFPYNELAMENFKETDSIAVLVTGVFCKGYADTYLQPGEPDSVELESVTADLPGPQTDFIDTLTDDQIEQLERDWLARFYDDKRDVETDYDPVDIDPYSIDDNDILYYPNIPPFEVPSQYETDYVNRHGIMPNAVAGNDQPENPMFEPLDYEVKITFRSAVPLETVSNFAYPERPIKWLCETGCGCGESPCEHEQRNRYVAYGRGTKEQLETAIKDYINEYL